MKELSCLEYIVQLLKEMLDSIDADKRYIVFLTDADGNIVYVADSSNALPVQLIQGMSCRLSDMGKNAVAAAMATQRLSSVANEQHTWSKLKQCVSIALPLPTDSAAGYLAMITDDRASVDMAKVMLSSLARFIAVQIRMKTALEDLKVRTKFESAIIKSISDGFLVLQPDGVITHANTAGARMLGVEPEQMIGRRLTEFVRSKLAVLEVFNTGEPIIDKELFVNTRDKTLQIIKTAVPVHDEDGRVIAVIDNFREIKNVRNLVNQMFGAKASFTFKDIVYKSKEMAGVVSIAKDIAKSPLSVLIQGESGTGKELFAHAIHNASERRNGPFVIIDCASIPRDLVESELFGYVDGAFTGARKGGRPGKFEMANGGTVFLDEIGEMPLEIQPKFLRVLQSRQIVRVGGTKTIPVDIRVIAATNRDLAEQVSLKNFRSDLFYRLNVLVLRIPALRERPDDIMVLAEYYRRKYEEKLGKTGLSFSHEVKCFLENHCWPGNVRELENVIARAVHIGNREITMECIPQLAEAALTADGADAFLFHSFADMKKRTIAAALQTCRGNRTQAAKMLGIARSTLYKKIVEYGLG